MREHPDWYRLRNVMRREEQLLEEFGREENDIREAMVRRDWPALEQGLGRLETLSTRIVETEEKRYALATALEDGTARDDIHIEDDGRELPGEVENEIRRLREALRARLLRVRSRNNGLMSYASAKGAVVRQILEELVPERRGRLYTRRGLSREGRSQSLLLNRHL